MECIIKNGGLVDATVLVPQLDFQESHFTPLLFAIELKCLPSVKVLLRSGASVNVKVNSNGRTVLFTAVQTNTFKIVKEVLDYKPDITEFDNKQSLPLAVSGNGEISRLIVNSLLDYGLVIDATFIHDMNFIFEAVTNGHISIVGQLLERGANVNSKDSNDNSILYRAVEQDNLKMVEEILKYKPDVNEKSSIESFTIAVSGDGDHSKRIVESLLEYGFSINSERLQDKTFIFNAVKKNHVSMVGHLLSRGMDVNIKDHLGYSILYTAVRHKNLNMVQEILKYKPDIQDTSNIQSLTMGVSAYAKSLQLIVENLLEYGFPITSKNKQNEKFMLDTIRNHHLKVMDLLIKSGANVNAEIQGKCLLEVGFSSRYHYHTDMAKLLIENGAQVKNELLKKAAENWKPDFVELFLQHGADPNFTDENGRTLLYDIANTSISCNAETRSIAISLLKFGAKIDTQTKQGNTVLHVCCKDGGYFQKGDVEFLCKHGARVDIKNESGKTALHLVIESGNIATVRTLLSHGANIHSRDNEGRTPLHIACLLWITEKIRFLIEHGANVDCKDNNGGSAIQVSLRADGRLANSTGNIKIMSETDCNTFDLMLNCSSNNIQDLIKTTELLMSKQQSSNYNRSRMRCTLVKHVSKLRELGFHDDEDDIQFQRMFKQLTNTIDQRELTTFVSRCSVEVQIMKVESIGDTKISYYDFLRKTCHRVALCLKNKSFCTGLELSQFKTSFPSYATMVENKFKQGQMRLNLLKEVNLERQYLFPELTFDCVQELLEYLDIEDFHTLVRVFPADRNVSVVENPTSPIATDKEDILDISTLAL
uniref:Ankyrin repeat protein RF_0381 n=1 Tax=Cacopsylla melanoneura TaxID=428564 RepID=A0A8D8QF42_9HEMI